MYGQTPYIGIMTNTNNTANKAWNCRHCHATNVHTGACGCQKSYDEAGRVASKLTVDDIVIDLNAK